MSPSVYFVGWVLLLSVLLLFPVSKLIWVLSVRKLQRKMRRELSEQETEAQLRRARILAVFIVVIFSFLFNAHVIGVPGNG
ncbi:MAG: hypothetical protein IH808_13875 [Proteobacteria bacterium]|nr:hypothetical protein [Pseudomonadota bacterium]